MREIPVNILKPIPALPGALLHKSCSLLLEKGDRLSPGIVEVIRSQGVKEVWMLEARESLDRVQRERARVPVSVESIHPGEKLSATIFDKSGRLLFAEGTIVPKGLVKALRTRGINIIYRRARKSQDDIRQVRAIRDAIVAERRALLEAEAAPPVLFDEASADEIRNLRLPVARWNDFIPAKLEAKLNRRQPGIVETNDPPFADRIRDTRVFRRVSKEDKVTFSNIVIGSLRSTRELLTDLATEKKQIDLYPIEEVIANVMAGIIHHRDLLTLCSSAKTSEHYLVAHALSVMALSVNIAASMGFSTAQIKALAYGGLLADVGLLRIPPHLLNKQEPLTPAEYARIRQHPALGLNVLQGIHGLPEEVPFIVYQSHERGDGSGYPKGKKEAIIHTFSRIVSTADCYQALCSDRPYRKRLSFYEAARELVVMASRRQMDVEIIRAFLDCNSLFPIGSFVRLSDGEIARVLTANPGAYDRPIVRKIWDSNFRPVTRPERIDLKETPELSVIHAFADGELPNRYNHFIGF
ncbi:MAG: HD domain-containing protein [Planctomycetes bacterium]|nr:HD domain-containing protein [Planctomycetota bacterium]